MSANRARVLADLKACAIDLLTEVKDFYADLDIAEEVKDEDNSATMQLLAAAIDGLSASISALKEAQKREDR